MWRLFTNVLCLIALSLAATGCSSVYHRTRLKLPPGPCAQLKLRIEQARRAERFTVQAGSKLREHLHRTATGETLQTDLDRLAMAAFDLERRVMAAQDVAGVCEQQPQPAGEMELLRLRAKAWLDFIATARQADSMAQERQLDTLLRGSPAPE